MSVQIPKKPNFFIIGAPKCGTTALSEYLRLHPHVFLSNPKEPEYFATDFAKRVISRKEDYLRLFQTANPAQHTAIGEASTIYLFSREAIPNILQFQPEAKFIAMLRSPVDLAVSFHAHLLAEGLETIPSFLEAWNAETERRAGKRLPTSVCDPKFFFYSEWGKLGTQLQRALEWIPKGRIKILLYDEFAQDTRTAYRDILAFLNLPDDGRAVFPVIRERRQPRNLRVQRMLGWLFRMWLRARVYVTGGRGLGLGDLARRLTTRSVREKNIDEATRRLLMDYYGGEIRLLESLLGRDLNRWLSVA